MSIYRATWTALVAAMSASVVARLSAQGLPPLSLGLDGSPGKIEIGPQFVAQQGSPPRILMIPRRFPFENSRDVVSHTGGRPTLNPTWDPRAIGVQWKTFEVQCWGCNFTDQTTIAPDPALDYDAAQILCEMVWQAAQEIAPGVWSTKAGDVDVEPKLIRLGHVISFDLAFNTPAPDATLPYAPNPTTGTLTTEISINGGAPIPP